MTGYVTSILIGGAFALAAILVLQLWKKIKMMGSGALAFILIFLPQAQGYHAPNQKLYTLFGLVCSTIGVIILVIHVFRLGMKAANDRAKP